MPPLASDGGEELRLSPVRSLGIALISISLLALQGPAAAKKESHKQGLVKTVLYLEGSMDLAELEAPFLYQALSPQTPDASSPRSKTVTSYSWGPNPRCAGQNLAPVFIGAVRGTVVGPIQITLHSVSTPLATVDLRIWPDVTDQLCDSDVTGEMAYPEPGASVVAPLPPGPGVVEVETPAADFEAEASIMFQVTPMVDFPFVGRVLYDAGSHDSRIEFMCRPPKGADSCVLG